MECASLSSNMFFASIAMRPIENIFLVIGTVNKHFYGKMSLVSPQNKLKIEVCTICFKKIRDACFSPPKIWINRKMYFFHPPQKKRWFLTYYFNKDMFVTKTEQDCGDFSMDIFCPQRATPSTVATCWIFFTGRRLDLKNDLPLFVVIFLSLWIAPICLGQQSNATKEKK